MGIVNSAKETKYFLCVLCEIEEKHLCSDTRLGSPLVRCGPAKQDQIFINMMIDDNISLKHYLELNEELLGPVPAGMTSQT